jgi:glycerate 2-kinase
VRLVAAGKAAAGMADAALAWFGGSVRGGLVATPEPSRTMGPLECLQTGHPVPTAASERAGRRAIEIAAALEPGETLVVLLSGGASALLEASAPAISLMDMQAATDLLLRSGADIHALNTVRRHLSDVKGGWLAARAAGPVTTFAVSDVIGDAPCDIGSGPTAPDPTTFADALEILRRFAGVSAYPDPVVRRLREGALGLLPETPKPGDERLARAAWRLIGSRHDAMAGAAAEATARDYRVERLDDPVEGEARRAGEGWSRAMLARAAGERGPLCVVASGETTVHVTGTGRGGRNQEFALSAAPVLDGAPTAALASVGTDGIDGPTDAAGGLVDSTTMARARTRGLDPSSFLRANNAYAFFEALGDLIQTGPTGTNVGDLQVILLA